MAFSEENYSLTTSYEKDEFENMGVASTPIALGIVQKTTIEIGNEAEFFDLFRVHEPTSGLSKVEGLSTSAVTLNDYPVRPTLAQRYEISKAAEDFISRQKKSVKYKEEIFVVADRTVEFLGKKGILAKVVISLFVDPEYINWIEPRISVEVRKEDLQETYRLFTELLEYSLANISNKTLKKLVVTVNSAQ
ncbi:MAG TPA: hypothetical protein VI864_04290 [Candidatus Bathyarchaeia archaeon]|nr:hypothetical protein [Candidatus Bathyarchaeia archaeon]